MSIIRPFLAAIRQGVRTGVYGGPLGQTLAIVLLVLALFLAGGVKSGFITTDELRSDPVGTTWKMLEPTVEDLRGKWDEHFGDVNDAPLPASASQE